MNVPYSCQRFIVQSYEDDSFHARKTFMKQYEILITRKAWYNLVVFAVVVRKSTMLT